MASLIYNTGCIDINSNPLSHPEPVDPWRQRLFRPSHDPRCATTLHLPSKLTVFDAGTTQLTFPWAGDQYLKSKGLGDEVHLLGKTLVIEVSAKARGDLVVGSRFFGAESPLNRASLPKAETTHKAICDTICIGCQNAGNVNVGSVPIDRVIFITSSAPIIASVTKFWEYCENRWSVHLEGGLTKMDIILLRHNIKHLEDKGIQVQFWKVDAELIVGPNILADDHLIKYGKLPSNLC